AGREEPSVSGLERDEGATGGGRERIQARHGVVRASGPGEGVEQSRRTEAVAPVDRNVGLGVEQTVGSFDLASGDGAPTPGLAEPGAVQVEPLDLQAVDGGQVVLSGL